MDYTLSIVEEPDYLHAIVTGTNSVANVASYMRDVLTECKTRSYHKVLIEERLDGPRLSIVDVFQVASDGSAQAIGALSALAYVDVNAVGDTMEFAETVASNRSLPARVFETVDDAKKWIVGQ